MTLQAVLVEALDGDSHAGARLGGCHGCLIDPSLEDRSKAAFAEHAVRTEVSSGSLQVAETQVFEVGRLQDVILGAQDQGEGGR